MSFVIGPSQGLSGFVGTTGVYVYASVLWPVTISAIEVESLDHGCWIHFERGVGVIAG